MSMNLLKTHQLGSQALRVLQKCRYTTDAKHILGDIEVEDVPVYDVEPKYTAEELDAIRNKSRLEPHHRNILNDKAPYQESQEYYHDQVWYRRKVLGKYGMDNAMVNPKYCWPTREEVEDIKEYERVLYPQTMHEVWQQIEEKKKQAALEIKQREEEIDKVVANFGKWQAELQAKIAKKEAELLAAKQRKEALLEEVREYFGFKIDQKDERFQEMIAQKEKEDKKIKKEEKKKKRAEKMMAYLTKQSQTLEIKNDESNKAPENESANADEKKLGAKESKKSPKGDGEKAE